MTTELVSDLPAESFRVGAVVDVRVAGRKRAVYERVEVYKTGLLFLFNSMCICPYEFFIRFLRERRGRLRSCQYLVKHFPVIWLCRYLAIRILVSMRIDPTINKVLLIIPVIGPEASSGYGIGGWLSIELIARYRRLTCLR